MNVPFANSDSKFILYCPFPAREVIFISPILWVLDELVSSMFSMFTSPSQSPVLFFVKFAPTCRDTSERPLLSMFRARRSACPTFA